MKIAEFFVNLRIKGDNSAKKGLKDVKSGLGEVKSMSLEAKAAIIGAIYALERMMSDSAKAGTGFMNFASLTGQSAIALQQWQFAARQVGVANEEVEGSFKSVQQAMTNMLLGKGAPEGMAMLANKVGFDPNRARDTFYVLEQLQKFAKEVPEDVGNAMIRSFGVSDNMIAAMRRNAFRPEVFKKAPVYSQGEINQLNKVDVAWANLGNKIKMAIGHLTSKHGLEIVNEISQITNQVLRLTDALVKLAEKLKIFQLIGKVFEGWGIILEHTNAGIDSWTTDKDSYKSAREPGKGGTAQWWKDAFANDAENIGNFLKGVKESISPTDYSKIAPPSKQIPPSNKTQNINVNQNLNFQHDGKDAKKTGASVNKAVKDAYRQLSAQAQGS